MTQDSRTALAETDSPYSLDELRQDLVHAARLMCCTGNIGSALALVERVIAEVPPFQEEEALIYLDIGGAGAAGRALAVLKQKLNASPDDVDNLALLRRAYAELGYERSAIVISRKIDRLLAEMS